MEWKGHITAHLEEGEIRTDVVWQYKERSHLVDQANLERRVCTGMNCIRLVQFWVRWWALMNTAMNNIFSKVNIS
jgi:hypothetical protein